MADVSRREFVMLSALSSFGLLIGLPFDISARTPGAASISKINAILPEIKSI